MDNLTEYANPELYDLENQDFGQDGIFLLDYARKLGGAVLEMGCGTGRITIPLAQNGMDITGVDIVPEMIARARIKAGDLPVQWSVQDIRCLALDRSFRLIFETGSVFQHLLTRSDQEAYLSRVHAHLDVDGRFVFSVLFPHPDYLETVAEEKAWFSYQNSEGRDVHVSGTEYYDPIRQVKVETAYRRWVDDRGQEILKVAPLSLRMVYPQELEVLLHYNGFEIVEQYGDWEKNLLTEESRAILSICRKG